MYDEYGDAPIITEGTNTATIRAPRALKVIQEEINKYYRLGGDYASAAALYEAETGQSFSALVNMRNKMAAAKTTKAPKKQGGESKKGASEPVQSDSASGSSKASNKAITTPSARAQKSKAIKKAKRYSSQNQYEFPVTVAERERPRKQRVQPEWRTDRTPAAERRQGQTANGPLDAIRIAWEGIKRHGWYPYGQ